MKCQKIAKTIMIISSIALCIISILLLNLIISSKRIDNSNTDHVITSKNYRGAEITSQARGNVTESEVDSIIKDHGADGLKIINATTGASNQKAKYSILVICWCVVLLVTVQCYRILKTTTLKEESL